jgi:hypothetical protein
MKYLPPALTSLLLLAISFGANAQTKTGADYFEGKWNVLVKSLPQGDTKMVFTLDKKDASMTGAVQDSTGKEIAKLDKVELGDNTVTVYFSAQGYDVNLVMNKKDDDHVNGTLMGMFDAEGDRVKVAQ